MPAEHRRHPLRRWTIALLSFTGLTVFIGAFVAGLRAGFAYNDFPLMNGQWIPAGILGLEPLWRNFFENPATVQFTHRVLAMSTLVLAVLTWWRMRARVADPGTRRAFHLMLAIVVIQVVLGITTLMLYVPVVLGTLHQGTAVLILAGVIAADYRISHGPVRAPAHSGKLTPAPA